MSSHGYYCLVGIKQYPGQIPFDESQGLLCLFCFVSFLFQLDVVLEFVSLLMRHMFKIERF